MASRPSTAATFGMLLALGAAAAAAQTAPQANPDSSSQPDGGSCPAGGKFVADSFAPPPAFPQQTRAPRQADTGDYRLEIVATDVAYGRAMAFLPDGSMLLAERGGRIRNVSLKGVLGMPLAGVPSMPEPSAVIGLMDLVVDPGFAKTRTIYFSYNTPKESERPALPFGRPPEGTGHIAKARLSKAGDRMEKVTSLYEGARVRRLLRSDDGTLFFTTIVSDTMDAQSLERDGGKVMRIKTDGGAPSDNPFADRADLGRFAYDLGQRDADGIAFDARGRVWTVEHGPRGGDELNVIRAGANYGFPIIGYGREYSGAEINGGLTVKEGLEQPIYFWTPDIAPSGLMIYSGKLFPQWEGNIFLGGLVAESLLRLSVRDDKVVSEAFMLAKRCERIRDVREAPDGSIYVLTDAAAGEVLRLRRAAIWPL
jgi:glucose/arabinose dehydrogenase